MSDFQILMVLNARYHTMRHCFAGFLEWIGEDRPRTPETAVLMFEEYQTMMGLLEMFVLIHVGCYD